MPDVIRWTGEHTLSATVVVTPRGVAYADAAQDAQGRDRFGVLWQLCGGQSTGRPAYAASLHPARQKAAMEDLRCAVCTVPADRDASGMRWVLPLPDDVTPDAVWEGVRTSVPPLCALHADSAPRLCPRLREGHGRAEGSGGS
ncbi:hypothetical protein ACFT38_28445 [Streptomyces sp. NPDC056975]|uniref:hypothetical protein n=1 Tax=Streptomyces sp. NPDC056975 TaxID=3345985 RepID=UPI00362EA423